jgi:2,5-furandicarboxylate decarboxylase 1
MKNNSADLRGFLSTLQSDNELVRVKRDVNAEYEIAAVSARLDGKQAVLFEKVRKSKIRVVTNVIATPRRFYLALGGSNHIQQM